MLNINLTAWGHDLMQKYDNGKKLPKAIFLYGICHVLQYVAELCSLKTLNKIMNPSYDGVIVLKLSKNWFLDLSYLEHFHENDIHNLNNITWDFKNDIICFPIKNYPVFLFQLPNRYPRKENLTKICLYFQILKTLEHFFCFEQSCR